MSAHTPGPWHVSGTYSGNTTVAIMRCADRQVTVNAEVGGTWNQTDANAQLIAAAPTLLAALEAAQEADDALAQSRDARARLVTRQGRWMDLMPEERALITRHEEACRRARELRSSAIAAARGEKEGRGE